jgi:hypothetical protein
VTSLSGANKREVRDNREKWWKYTTGRSQNISLIVPLFTFVGHYRGISYVIMYLLYIKVYSVVVCRLSYYVPLSSARQNKESEKGLLNTKKKKTNTRTYEN